MTDIKISLHDGKSIVQKLSSAIADLEMGDSAGSLEQLRDLELWLHGKFILLDDLDPSQFGGD